MHYNINKIKNQKMYNLYHFQFSAAPSYPKPLDEDIVKLCIINGSGSSKSLIKHLKLEYENQLEPLIAEYNFKVRSNYTANIVECDEVRILHYTNICLCNIQQFVKAVKL